MVGYYTRSQDVSRRYAKPEYKKDKAEYMPKLFDFDKMQAFMRERSSEMNELFKAAVDKVLEAHFTLYMGFSWYNDYIITMNCVLAATEALTEEEEETLNAIGEAFQKKLAKEVNKQPFTETEYGYVKMPKTAQYGFHFVRGPINPQDILSGRE